MESPALVEGTGLTCSTVAADPKSLSSQAARPILTLPRYHCLSYLKTDLSYLIFKDSAC